MMRFPLGVGIGLNAALISIITAWLSDIKLGYCTTGWWLSQKFCCLELSDEGTGCEEWRNWGGIEPFRYIAFILFAVRGPDRRLGKERADILIVAGSGSPIIHRSQARQVIRSLCSGFRNLRNQMHHWRIRHQRFPLRLDVGHQELDAALGHC